MDEAFALGAPACSRPGADLDAMLFMTCLHASGGAGAYLGPAMEQAEYLQVCQKLATEFVGQEADHAEVVWAKVKSYPMWPVSALNACALCNSLATGNSLAHTCSSVAVQAQVLSQAAVQKWLSGVKQPKDTVPVMFFSDLTVAWVSVRLAGRYAICAWEA